jgi:hypothetical protein
MSMLTACGTTQINMVSEGKVQLELIPSDYLHFSRVSIYRTDTGVLVVGELHTDKHGRGSIPGYIVIEVITPDGGLLTTISSDYQSGSFKSRKSQFAVEIPNEIPVNSTVRITHHDTVKR